MQKFEKYGRLGLSQFFIAHIISDRHTTSGSIMALLTAGIAFNLPLLGTFKYMGFSIANLNEAGITAWVQLGTKLLLSISFFSLRNSLGNLG